MADYNERVLLVEVAGIRQQGVMQTNHATFKVPYCSLSRSLQLIKLKGGRIVRIHPLASSLISETLEAPSPKAPSPKAPSPKAVESPSPKTVEASLPKTTGSPSPKTAESPLPLPVESRVPKQSKLSGLLRRLLRNP